MTTLQTDSAWRTFWNRGGFWRAVLAAVVYMAFYLGAGLLVGQLFGDQVDAENIFADVPSVFFGLLLPLVVGAVVLTVFLSSVGWWRPLFAREPLPGKGWMWVAPVLVAIPVVLRLLGIDYAGYASGVVATTLVAGLFVGFVEEVLTRGIAVKMLRDAGHGERTVMVLSSLLFALLHSANALSGQPIVTVLATMGFTFAFGIVMYLTLRVTGSLVWPIVLHALYDPTLFLATGGIDTAAEGTQNALLTLAGPANLLYILLAVVALFLVRNVRARRGAEQVGAPAA